MHRFNTTVPRHKTKEIVSIIIEAECLAPCTNMTDEWRSYGHRYFILEVDSKQYHTIKYREKERDRLLYDFFNKLLTAQEHVEWVRGYKVRYLPKGVKEINGKFCYLPNYSFLFFFDPYIIIHVDDLSLEYKEPYHSISTFNGINSAENDDVPCKTLEQLKSKIIEYVKTGSTFFSKENR